MSKSDVRIEYVHDLGYSSTPDNLAYYPAIIHFKCPVCGRENEMNLMAQPIEAVIGTPFVVTLVCDGSGCEFEKEILIQTDFKITVLNDNFKSDEEYEKKMKEYYETEGKYKAFRKEIQKGIFLRN